jgi:hypothetical protein
MDSYETEDKEIEIEEIEEEIETGIIKKNHFLVTRSGNQKEEKIYTSIYVFGRKISLYIPKAVWEAFKEIAREEGVSASKLAEKAFIEFVQSRLPKVNPQMRLSSYIKPEEDPPPLRVLCVYCDGALSEGKVFCQKRGMWIPSITCYSCKDNRLRKKEGDAWIRGK